MKYDDLWRSKFQDVVVCLPNGGRFVFWRGASYVPFWASQHNTGLTYEWAERLSPNVGFVDCPEPITDKELRYSRVEIVESTAARVHVRWTYQSCDFNYKVNGDLCTEDFYFYPDGFGTRAVTLTHIPEAEYELAEFIVITPQAAFPLDILPANQGDILAINGEKASLRFPHPQQQEGWKKASNLPAVYRIRLNKQDPLAAISFSPHSDRHADSLRTVFRSRSPGHSHVLCLDLATHAGLDDSLGNQRPDMDQPGHQLFDDVCRAEAQADPKRRRSGRRMDWGR